MEEWAYYAQSQMSTSQISTICMPNPDSHYFLAGPDAPDTVALPTTQRKKKAAVEFELDDNDVPILSDPSQLMARDMEPLVRQYMSIHYSKSCKGEMNDTFVLYSNY
jgi:hypothetical protein